MQLIKPRTLLVFLPLLALAGCDYGGARKEFDRQIKVCSVAEGNGLLEPAVQACGAALAIAEEQTYEPELVSDLLYRLGRLERQRGRLQEAEPLVRRSLELEEQSGDQSAAAMRLVELSLIVAGQGRWLDGAKLLERAAPLAVNLSGDDRTSAANAFTGFSVRLSGMGHPELAEQMKARAQELAGS